MDDVHLIEEGGATRSFPGTHVDPSRLPDGHFVRHISFTISSLLLQGVVYFRDLTVRFVAESLQVVLVDILPVGHFFTQLLFMNSESGLQTVVDGVDMVEGLVVLGWAGV